MRNERLVMLPDAHALSIGISQCRHIRPLTATQDAVDVAGVLRDGGLCGYPDANVRLLLDEGATKVAILGELDRLAARTTERSTVFIYFSGHGGRADGDAGDTCFLMPADGRTGGPPVLSETAISGRPDHLGQAPPSMVAATRYRRYAARQFPGHAKAGQQRHRRSRRAAPAIIAGIFRAGSAQHAIAGRVPEHGWPRRGRIPCGLRKESDARSDGAARDGLAKNRVDVGAYIIRRPVAPGTHVVANTRVCSC